MPNPIMIPADPSANLAKGFANIADLFAPNDPTKTAHAAYYGSEAGLARAKTLAEQQKAQRLSDLYTLSQNPDADPRILDQLNGAVNNYAPNAGWGAIATKDATDRYKIGTESGDNRFRTTTEAGTSRANNADTNNRELIAAISAPTPEGSSRVIPPEVAARLGVPSQQNGIVKLNEGQTATLPPGPAGPVAPLQGNPKPLTEAEAKGRAIAGLTPEEQRALGLGEIKTGPVYGTPGGTAFQDPVDKSLKNTQDKTPLAPGTKATNLGAPTTTVNVGPNGEQFGAPPPNMAWKRKADGVTVDTDERGAPIALEIGGSPLDAKNKAAAEKKVEQDRQKAQGGGIVTQDVDRALSAIDADPTLTTGAGSQITGGIGGSPAKDLKGLLDSVRANVGFDRLQQMRASSPTGGALGQVSDKENALLQSVLGSLDQSQGPTQLKQNLKRVKDVTLDIVHGPGNGPARSHEPTAIDPQTKHRMVYRGGQWVSE